MVRYAVVNLGAFKRYEIHQWMLNAEEKVAQYQCFKLVYAEGLEFPHPECSVNFTFHVQEEEKKIPGWLNIAVGGLKWEASIVSDKVIDGNISEVAQRGCWHVTAKCKY